MRPASHIVAVLALLTAPPALAFTVAIDPGHGGVKAGAVSPYRAVEKNVALSVATKLRDLLKQADINTLMTRDSDLNIDLQDRTKIANQAHADVLVSIHCNSMETKAGRRETTGIETYFLSADATDAAAQAVAELENADVSQAENPVAADPISMILQDLSRMQAHHDSKALAEVIHRTLIKEIHVRDRGVRQAPFIVLLGAQMPAILVEIGFISHPVEGRKLAQPAYQEQVAEALRDAILQFRDTVFAKRTTPGSSVATASVVVAPSPSSPATPAVPPTVAVAPATAPAVDAGPAPVAHDTPDASNKP